MNRGAVGCAVVTGASSGIGAAVVRAMVASGRRVVASARREDRLVELARAASPGTVLAHPGDLTDAQQVETLFQRAVDAYGTVDVVVHSVGYDHPVGWFADLPLGSVEDAVAALVTSPALVVAQALRTMEGNGVVLVVSSGAADKGTPGRALYGAGKAAVNQIVASAGLELEAAGRTGIGIAALLPGRVDTPMQRSLVAAAWSAPDGFRLSGFSDTSKVITADAVGRAVTDLADWRPSALNGQRLRYSADGWVRV